MMGRARSFTAVGLLCLNLPIGSARLQGGEHRGFPDRVYKPFHAMRGVKTLSGYCNQSLMVDSKVR